MSTVGGISAMGAAMPQIVSGASMRMPPSQKMSNLFQQIDTGNTGSISKSQFEQAFQTLNPPKGFQHLGANAVWSQLDPSGTGSVSKHDFVNGMTSMMSQIRQHHHHNEQANVAAQSLAGSVNALNALGNQPAPAALGTIGNNINVSA